MLPSLCVVCELDANSYILHLSSNTGSAVSTFMGTLQEDIHIGSCYVGVNMFPCITYWKHFSHSVFA